MSNGEEESRDATQYHLRLFVAGNSPRSLRTIANLRRVCADRLAGRVDLEVVDIYQQPELAERDQVVAAPTLLKLSPAPLRRIIGDLTDMPRLLQALGLAGLDHDHGG